MTAQTNFDNHADIRCVSPCSICEQTEEVVHFDETKGPLCQQCTERWIDSPRSHNYINRIRQYGSQAQNEELERALEYIGAKEKEQEANEKMREYAKKIFQQPTPDQIPDIINANRYFMMRLTNTQEQKPESLSFALAKRAFWEAYTQIVWQESKIDLKEKAKLKKKVFDGEVKINDNARDAPLIQTELLIDQFVRYLIGDKNDYLDTSKSLYIWGSFGVGKSTMAYAGALLMDWVARHFSWKERKYSFVSMDEIMLQTYTTSNLEKLGSLANHNSIILDELKLEHLKYKHYGNDLLLINDILTVRHNIWKRTGHRTIITTNIAPAQLKENLDPRLQDRMKQEYQFIEVRGINKRHPVVRL